MNRDITYLAMSFRTVRRYSPRTGVKFRGTKTGISRAYSLIQKTKVTIGVLVGETGQTTHIVQKLWVDFAVDWDIFVGGK